MSQLATGYAVRSLNPWTITTELPPTSAAERKDHAQGSQNLSDNNY